MMAIQNRLEELMGVAITVADQEKKKGLIAIYKLCYTKKKHSGNREGKFSGCKRVIVIQISSTRKQQVESVKIP